MKVLVTGAGGMLAQALVPELRRQEMEVLALDRMSLDVTDPEAVDAAIGQLRPDAVVQCAGYTAVDRAELEPEAAFRTNAQAAQFLANSCQRWGALLVYPSTDYVFSGSSARPYRPDDPTGPLNVYGSSKAQGEEEVRRLERHLIVRTSWLYGAGGRNFVDSILRIAGEKRPLKVVNDQVGLPTWTGSLSYILARLLKVGGVGTFHAADGGYPLCWCDFAREILKLRGIRAEVEPVSSDDYSAAARRPRFSVLDCTKTEQMLDEPMPARAQSLVRYLASA